MFVCMPSGDNVAHGRASLLKQFVTPCFRHFQRLVYTLFGLHSFLFEVRTCSVSSFRSSLSCSLFCIHFVFLPRTQLTISQLE